jgi:hypothetical protein
MGLTENEILACQVLDETIDNGNIAKNRGVQKRRISQRKSLVRVNSFLNAVKMSLI